MTSALPSLTPGLPLPAIRRADVIPDLAAALEQRNGAAVVRISQRWVHRRGVEALEPLIAVHAPAEELRSWWLDQLAAAPAARTGGGEIATPAQSVPALDPPAPVEPAAPLEPVPTVVAAEFDAVAPEPIQPPAFLARSEPFVFELPALEPLPEPAVDSSAAVIPGEVPEWFSSTPVEDSTPSGSLQEPSVRESSPARSHDSAEPSPLLEAEATPPRPRRSPLSRLKTLVRDCLDEVASTFQSEELGSLGISDQATSPLQQEAPEPQFLQDPAALRPTTGPELPTVSRKPAPPAPGLASLRSWLPDQPPEQERRAS